MSLIPQAMSDRIQKRPQNPWPGEFEFVPEDLLRTALCVCNRIEREHDGPVGKVGPADDIFDAVEDDGPRRGE